MWAGGSFDPEDFDPLKVKFDDIARVPASPPVVVTRNHEEPNPNSDPPNQPSIMVSDLREDASSSGLLRGSPVDELKRRSVTTGLARGGTTAPSGCQSPPVAAASVPVAVAPVPVAVV